MTAPAVAWLCPVPDQLRNCAPCLINMLYVCICLPGFGCRVASGQLQEAQPLLAAATDMLSKQAEVSSGTYK
jgi:hypothetical protein